MPASAPSIELKPAPGGFGRTSGFHNFPTIPGSLDQSPPPRRAGTMLLIGATLSGLCILAMLVLKWLLLPS